MLLRRASTMILMMLLIALIVISGMAGEPPEPPGPMTTKQAMTKRAKGRAPENTTKTIKLKVQDMDLGELLITLAHEMGWNLVVDKSFSQKVSLDISKPIPIRQAFDMLLKLGNLKLIRLAERTYMVLPADKAKAMEPVKTVKVKLKYMAPTEMAKHLAGIAKVTADNRSGTLILQGRQEEIALAMRMIELLDTEEVKVVTEVVRLNDADPEAVLSTLKSLSNTMGMSNLSLIADKRTNSIVITGPKSFVTELVATAKRLDKRLPQVLIAVDVIELFKSSSEALGIDFSGGTMTVISESPVLSGYGGYYGGYAPQPQEGEGGGYEYFIKPPYDVHFRYRTPMQIQAIINFLYDKRHSKLLASPRVLTDDGQEARVMVGDRIPIINQVMTSTQPGTITTTTAYQVQFVEVGVLLSLTPRVTEDGYIHLDVNPQVSTLKGFMEGFAGTKVPEIGTREVKLKVTVPDGEPIILGGLIREDERKARVKVPILGELPIIGPLFRSNSDSDERSEIVFVIRPKVIDWRRLKRSENPALYKGELTEEKLDGKP